jgi:hypothetical protein
MAQDISYFEAGYIDETYFVRTAEGVSTEPVVSSLTADATVIFGASVTIVVAFTQITTVSETRTIELFAFSNAQLTAQAKRIRTSNVALASSTALAVQATRIIYVLAQEASAFNLSAQSRRYRGITAASNAAFSSAGPLDDNGDRVPDAVGTITVAAAKATPRTTATLIGNING